MAEVPSIGPPFDIIPSPSEGLRPVLALLGPGSAQGGKSSALKAVPIELVVEG